MSINPISQPAEVIGPDKVSQQQSRKAYSDKRDTHAEQGAVFEKSAPTDKGGKMYKKDAASLSRISKQAQAKFAGLRGIVENMLKMQSVKAAEGKGLRFDQIFKKYDGQLKSYFENLQVDDATRLKAQQDIAEDGYWGVKQTSQRLIDMAISLSGGDTSKLAELKDAIAKGFAAAEKSWGGALPDICYQTREAVFKGLDDWADAA